MKNWLGAAGRFCVDFVLVLLLCAASATLMANPGKIDMGAFVSSLLYASESLYPLAVAATLFLASYAFERRLPSILLSWTSLLLLGLAFLAGGEALRRLDLIAPPAQSAANHPVSGFIEAQEGILYLSKASDGAKEPLLIEYEGDNALGLRLTTATKSEFSPSGESINLDGRLYTLRRGADTAKIPGLAYLGLDTESLRSRLKELDGLDYLQALALLGGLLLLAFGLSAFSRLPRWPLVGFFFAASAFLILLAADAGLASASAQRSLGPLLERLGLAALPYSLLRAFAEAVFGLLLASTSLIVVGRRRK